MLNPLFEIIIMQLVTLRFKGQFYVPMMIYSDADV